MPPSAPPLRLSSTIAARLSFHQQFFFGRPQSRSASSSPANPSLGPPDSLPATHSPLQAAYDHALAFLTQDALRLRQSLSTLRQNVLERPKDDQLRNHLQQVEIQSEINDVHVRSLHRQGLGDMSKPVFRHLREQQWRKGGRLGRLMETVHRLRVFPDVLPAIGPTLDLTIKFGDQPAGVGAFIPSSESTKPPLVHPQVFHPEPRLYTLLMIDPDVPDPLNHTFTTFLHWLVPNVSLSATTSDAIPTPPDAKMCIPYIPPHPAQGSPLHRYTLLLLAQQSEIPVPETIREGFSVRQYVAQHGLQASGVFSWLSKWRAADADYISTIYRDERRIPEPSYGREPKPFSGRNRLPPNKPLPLTHRHPPVIPWNTTSSDTDSQKNT